MNFSSILLLVAVALPALVIAEHWQSPFLKTFLAAQQECTTYLRLTNETLDRYVKSGYPDEESTRKLVHCILVNVNAWDDAEGIKDYVIKNFFNPCPADSQNEQRAQQCLRETVSPLTRRDQLKRAHRSFLCYYRNYGNIVPQAQFVPYSKVTRKEHIKESIAIENIPRSSLEQYAKGNILDVPDFAEVIFTYTVRTGYYEPDNGMNIGRLFTQFGIPELLCEKTKCCEANVRKQFCDEPARILQTFKQCYASILPTSGEVQEVAQELIAGPPPPPCGNPPPPCASALPSPPPPPCSRCGSPSPCSSCNRRFPLHPRPCYNGQCDQ